MVLPAPLISLHRAVIIERPHPAPTVPDNPSPPQSQPRKGIWVRTGGVLDFMRTLYQNILDRDPESHAAIEGWTREVYARGLAYAVGGFFTSIEYTAKGVSTEATVDKFYLSVLGRHPEAEGRAHWTEEIRRGMSLWTVAEKLVGSEEYRRRVAAEQAPDPIHWPE